MDSIQAKKIDNIMNVIEFFFKFLFLTLVLLSFNSFVAGSVFLAFLSYFTVIVGAVVILYRIINFKKYYKTYALLILIVFGASYVISSLVNYKYGVLENIQAIIWMVLQFGILYAFDCTKSPDSSKKQLDMLLKYFLIYVLLANIIGLVMLLVNYGYSGYYSFSGNNIGFLWGRLWGVYSDPNNGSVFCAAAIIISVYYATLTKKKLLKAAYIISIILSFLYIMFSDSRTGLVCLALGVFAFAYLIFNASKRIKTNGFVKQIICLSLAIFIAVASVVSLNLTKIGYNYIAEQIYNSSQENPDKQQPSRPETTIGRDGDELSKDVSNRRFDLWKSGFEIWQHSPLVGTAHRTIVSFAQEKVPDTYLVNNDFSIFNSTHNMIFDILVSQGLLGVIIFAVFIIAIFVLIFKKVILKKNQIKDHDNILYLSILIVFALSSMFILDILYVNSAGSFIFWAVLGQLVHKLTYTKPDDIKPLA